MKDDVAVQKKAGWGRLGNSPTLAAPGAISARLDELTVVGEGGEGTRLLLEAREQPGLLGVFNGSYWRQTLFNLRGRAIPWTELGVYMAYSVAVCAVNTQIPDSQRTDSTSPLRQLNTFLRIMGTLLFLLLAFRNNAAFNRWQQGADRFNSFVDRCKNLARLCAGNLPLYLGLDKAEAYPHVLHQLKWLMACVECGRQMLRGVQNQRALAHLIHDDADMAAVLASRDPVSYCLFKVQYKERSFRGEKDCKWFERADDMYGDFSACRAVLRTPIPFAYISHLRTFMVMWLAAVPWSFCIFFDWYTLILAAVIGYGVIGVEEAAVEVEQPFGTDFNDLPLDMIVAEGHQAMGGMLRLVREERRKAVAAGVIEPSDDDGDEEGGKAGQAYESSAASGSPLTDVTVSK